MQKVINTLGEAFMNENKGITFTYNPNCNVLFHSRVSFLFFHVLYFLQRLHLTAAV